MLKLNLTFRAETSQEIGPGTAAAGYGQEFHDTLLERKWSECRKGEEDRATGRETREDTEIGV